MVRPFALPGSSLRYGPDKDVDVLHIDLHLTPDLQNSSLAGVCTTTIRVLDEPIASLSLDAVDLRIEAVERDGKPLAFRPRDRKLDITFDPALAAGEEVTFSVRYSLANPRHGLFFIEPSPEYPKRVRHVWSQSQDENARYWFPCLDYPHEKQTTSATIVVPKGTFALSNGALIEKRDEGATTTYRYRENVPYSTYLTTLVAGPFVETEQQGAGIPVYFYVFAGREADGERAFGKTPQMLRVFEEKTGMPYPYERYSQIAVSEFIFGGMENTSATTQTERTLHDERAHQDFSSDPLVSHELAHQWFGDLLTCRDWSQAWLNEGFATFFEAVFREADLGRDEYVFDIFGCVERYLHEDAERYRRPIVCNRFRDPIELFDRHLYEKGGAVLHMLRIHLGEARFWRAIRHYVARNAGRSVETIDLIRAIEESTGRNLRAFFDQWVFRGGHPTLKISSAYDAKRHVLTIGVDQTQPIDDANPVYVFETSVLVDGRSVPVKIERAHETISIPLEDEPKLVVFDPEGGILGDISYALGVDFASSVLAGDAGVIAQIRAARELANDRSSGAQDALKRALDSEKFWGVRAEIAHVLGETHAPFALPLLVRAADDAHPKVRRAALAALGNFRDEKAASVLLSHAVKDSSYFAQSAALHALGKTRDPRAFDVLANAVKTVSWNGVIESGAAAGLGELADSRALPLLAAASKPGGDESLRRAALTGLARHVQLVEMDRSAAVDAIVPCLDDSLFMVSRAAIHATEMLADPRMLGTLDRLSSSAFDGRIRRDAAEAAIRVREAQKVPAQVTTLRTDLDALRDEQRRIQEKIEALSRS